jgi:hypothetical protein
VDVSLHERAEPHRDGLRALCHDGFLLRAEISQITADTAHA